MVRHHAVEMRTASRLASVSVVLVTALAACGTAPTDSVRAGEGSGSCANIAIFEGREYSGRNAVIHPTAGAVVGEARLPACSDTNLATTAADEFVSVAELKGVEPDIAIVNAMTPEVIYVRSDLRTLPPEVERYFHAPSCSPDDAPVELHGMWLGIVGPDETTELDMIPPYTLEMLVTRSTSPTYANSEITIEVPRSLGRPLTRNDVKTSLWEAGTLDVRATCDGDRFVAESVEAFAP